MSRREGESTEAWQRRTGTAVAEAKERWQARRDELGWDSEILPGQAIPGAYDPEANELELRLNAARVEAREAREANETRDP